MRDVFYTYHWSSHMKMSHCISEQRPWTIWYYLPFLTYYIHSIKLLCGLGCVASPIIVLLQKGLGFESQRNINEGAFNLEAPNWQAIGRDLQLASLHYYYFLTLLQLRPNHGHLLSQLASCRCLVATTRVLGASTGWPLRASKLGPRSATPNVQR